MRQRPRASLVLFLVVFAVGVLSLGTVNQPSFQEPKGSVMYIHDSRVKGQYRIQQKSPALSAFSDGLRGKIRMVDLAENPELDNTHVFWIHPSALSGLEEQHVAEIKQRMHEGTPVVYMDRDAKAFMQKFGIPELGLANQQGTATIVGIGFKYEAPSSQLPEYIVISVPNDRLESEGDLPALNALSGGSNQLLD